MRSRPAYAFEPRQVKSYSYQHKTKTKYYPILHRMDLTVIKFLGIIISKRENIISKLFVKRQITLYFPTDEHFVLYRQRQRQMSQYFSQPSGKNCIHCQGLLYKDDHRNNESHAKKTNNWNTNSNVTTIVDRLKGESWHQCRIRAKRFMINRVLLSLIAI